MTLYQFLRTLAARRRIVFYTVLAMFVILTLVCVVFPTKYTATASVVVSSQSEDPILGGLIQTPISEAFVSTQVDIISSPRVARRVVSDLKLDKDAELVDRWRSATDGKGDVVAWIGDVLLNYLKVKPGRDSNVIEINF